jgi:hypothetical protein
MDNDVEATEVEDVTRDSLAEVDVDVVVNKDVALTVLPHVTIRTNINAKLHKNITTRKKQIPPPDTVVYDASNNVFLLSPLSNQYPHSLNNTPKSSSRISLSRKQPNRSCKLLDKDTKEQLPRKLIQKDLFSFGNLSLMTFGDHEINNEVFLKKL